MRSAARKSATCSPTSAETTPTSVTLGKSCPLAIIWVPTSTSIAHFPETRQQGRSRAPAPHRVAVETRDADAREAFRHVRLDPLGAEADGIQIRSRTVGARGRPSPRVVAVVATHAARTPVKRQRHADSSGTRGCARTAGRARAGREPAPVQQDQRLLAPRQRALEGVDEGPADHHVRPGIGGLRTHVDHLPPPGADAGARAPPSRRSGSGRCGCGERSPAKAWPNRGRPGRRRAARARSRRCARDSGGCPPACRTCRAPRRRPPAPARPAARTPPTASRPPRRPRRGGCDATDRGVHPGERPLC